MRRLTMVYTFKRCRLDFVWPCDVSPTKAKRHSDRGELLNAIDGNRGDGAAALGGAAAVGLDGDGLARLGGDSEADLGEVGELLARRPGEGEHARVLGIRHDRGNVVHRDAVVSSEEGKLVDGHVLEHALRVALEALAELLLLVRVVV